MTLPTPPETAPHSDDLAVDRFAAALKERLAQKRGEGAGGWDDRDDCTCDELAWRMTTQLRRGKPVDVGAYAMMLHLREGGADALKRMTAVWLARAAR